MHELEVCHNAGVVAPFTWTFVPNVFLQSPQNVAIEFFIHHLGWWNKFLMHDTFHGGRRKDNKKNK
jgi:hypothetical protein